MTMFGVDDNIGDYGGDEEFWFLSAILKTRA